jgi:hypothetical protein
MQPHKVWLFYQGQTYIPKFGVPTSPMQLPFHIFPLRGGGRSCIALIDWGECSQPPEYLDWDLLLPIFATNPDFRRTRHFVERRDPFVWGMPTWTRSELGKG